MQSILLIPLQDTQFQSHFLETITNVVVARQLEYLKPLWRHIVMVVLQSLLTSQVFLTGEYSRNLHENRDFLAINRQL
jgi:hypothetical protein